MRSFVSGALLALVTALPSGASARPLVCLPPVFDGGLRLHPLPTPRVYWLPLLLRQHELCWRPDDEVRVAVFGNSAVYGLPLPADQTFESAVNRNLDAKGIRAHLFNLGFVTSYQVKDALILHDALAYEPDVVVFALSLSDFQHVAPMPFKSVVEFFDRNRAALKEMIVHPPKGLEEPLMRFAQTRHKPPELWAQVRLNEFGRYMRAAARTNALWLQTELHSPPAPPVFKTAKRRKTYDCDQVQLSFETNFADWQQWNILAELERLQRERNIKVLVVGWPIAYEPVGDCYSFRYPRAAVRDFLPWISAQTKERGLAFVDLHDLLPPELFVDSIHVTAAGHQRIAAALEPVLEPLLRRAAAR